MFESTSRGGEGGGAAIVARRLVGRDAGALPGAGGASGVGVPSAGAAAAGGGEAGDEAAGERVLAVVEALTAGLREALGAAGTAVSWSPGLRARVLGALDRVPGVVAGVRAPVLAAAAARAVAVGNEREFVDTRARLTGSTRWQAAGQLEAARVLGDLDQVRAAVTGSVMPVGHVEVLARRVAGASQVVSGVLAEPATQARVVELARGTDVREFSRSLDALVATLDPDTAADAREASRRARFLSLSHTPDGTFLKGRLDPVGGQALARALAATGHHADDDRTPEQARADALTALARHTLTTSLRAGARPAPAPPSAATLQSSTARSHTTHRYTAGPGTAGVGTAGVSPPRAGAEGVRAAGNGPASAGAGVDSAAMPASRDGGDLDLPDGTASAPTAQISLLVPAETWHAVRDLQQRRRDHSSSRRDRPLVSGSSTDMAAPPPRPHPGSTHRPVPTATTDDGTPISPTELAAALCDCAMTRVVMTSTGLPLDVGRTRRTFTPAQRTAVVARDRGCAWNGCSAPPAVSEVHHITWWHRDTGPTDLTNAVLLCSFHHHEVHRRDLDIHRLPPPSRTDGATSPHPTRYRFTTTTGATVNAPYAMPPPDR